MCVKNGCHVKNFSMVIAIIGITPIKTYHEQP
jgi:hypothetical protein